MADKNNVKILIQQLPQIREYFHKGNGGSFATYNFSERRRVTSSIELDMIYDVPEFKSWRDELLMELSTIDEDEFIEEIKRLLSKFSGFGDKKRFENLESKLNVLLKNLDNYFGNKIENERVSDEIIIEKTKRALIKLQKNHENYDFKDEDTMNDFIRDLLGESFEVKDQTRQGLSENGKKAGEVDVQICKEGLPIVMIEGLILDSLKKEYLDAHIDKVLSIYDPNGCPYAEILIYHKGVRFESFWEKLVTHLTERDYPYEKNGTITEAETGYAELKHAFIVLNRNGMPVNLHIFAAHMC